jgi:hypothetical protein
MSRIDGFQGDVGLRETKKHGTGVGFGLGSNL